MIGWLIFLVYGAGFILSVTPITRGIVGDHKLDDAFEGILIGMLGAMLALLWPLVLIGWFVYTKAIQPTIKTDKP